MKKQIFVLFILILILISSLAVPVFAKSKFIQKQNNKSYLLYDNKTKEVVSLSNEDDAILQKGQTKVIINKPLWKLGLTKHPTYYKYINGDFVLNTEKVSKEYNIKKSLINKAKEIKMIKDRALFNACKELEGEGVTFKYVKCSDYK